MESSELVQLSELTLVQMCSSARRQLTGELVHLLRNIRVSAQVSGTAHRGRQFFT